MPEHRVIHEEETTMKISTLTALTVVLSILAASAAQAGGRVTGSDFHSGASAATSGQSQGQNGGHVHNDGGKVVGSDF
jgi:uncharacterized membrane protein